MRYRIKCNRICGALALLLTLAVVAASSQVTPREPSDERSVDVTLDSKEAAALLVAFDDYRDRLKENGIVLTAAELARRHRSVRLRRQGVKIDVYFYPDSKATAGGDVAYLVNADELTIIERFFGR